ncbi:MAG TPA: nitroreductase [Steroidobacteraceae bacterium]|nr:nitroreductase [Steroidobacteraceae bacterium]
MDVFTAIDTRASSLKLVEPGPSHADLERIMLSGTRAPDHGKLTPWRFVVLEGAGRHVLANAMATSFKQRVPQATDAQLEAERKKPLRAPTIIVVAARIVREHKIPAHEQIMAVAAAVENMFLSAHALGYGVMWKTGEAARDPFVKQALGLNADDEIVSFLYLGTNETPGPVRVGSLESKVRWIEKS